MKQAILLITILLIGCSKPIEIKCENITINNTIETIKFIDKYINITIKEPCNLTCSKERELELIRRIKFLEEQQDNLMINETECIDNDTKTNYEDKLDMYERDIEELEDELDNCTKEVCRWNSSEC